MEIKSSKQNLVIKIVSSVSLFAFFCLLCGIISISQFNSKSNALFGILSGIAFFVIKNRDKTSNFILFLLTVLQDSYSPNPIGTTHFIYLICYLFASGLEIGYSANRDFLTSKESVLMCVYFTLLVSVIKEIIFFVKSDSNFSVLSILIDLIFGVFCYAFLEHINNRIVS